MPIQKPYSRKTVIHTQSDIESWETVTLANDESVTKELRGKTFLMSPAFGKAGKEQNHHSVEIKIEGREFDKINVHMGHAPVDTQIDRVYSTYYYTIDFIGLTAGTFKKDYPAAYGNRRFNWWLIEVNPNVKVTEIKHTYHQCPDGITTWWMHEGHFTHEFMGGRMHYAISYPPNYDSEDKTKKYPLMISVAGSGELGDDKRYLNQIDPGCIITRYYDFYTEFPCIHVSIQIPYYNSFTEPLPEPEMYPYHDGWSRYYHERGYGAVGCKEIIDKLVADPDYNIDTDRLYCSGLSGGGLFSFEMLKGGRDYFAAVVPTAAWAIGRAYENVFNNSNWDTPYPDGGDSLKERLRKEIMISKHIPTLIAVGGADNMKYGSEAFKIVAEEEGLDCQLQIYPNVKHAGASKVCWGKRENVEWLFSQTKKKDIPVDPYPDRDFTKPPVEPIKYISIEQESAEYIVLVDDAEVFRSNDFYEALNRGLQEKQDNPGFRVDFKEAIHKVIKLD